MLRIYMLFFLGCRFFFLYWPQTVTVTDFVAKVIDKSADRITFNTDFGKIKVANMPFIIGSVVGCDVAKFTQINSYHNPQDQIIKLPHYNLQLIGCYQVSRVASWITKIRLFIKSTLDASGIKTTQFVESMLLGKAKFLPQQLQVLQQTGILHLIAISGLHISLLLFWMQWLLQRMIAPIGFKYIAANFWVDCLALSVIACYVLLVNSPVSAWRALLMAAVVVITKSIGMQGMRLLGLEIAAFVLVCVSPIIVFSAGFWLSFGGALLLLVVDEKGGVAAIKTYVLMFLGMGIISAKFFYYVALSGLVANFLAIPVFSSWLVPLSIIGALGSLLSVKLAYSCWWLAQLGLDLIWPWLQLLSQYGYVNIAHAPSWMYWLAFCGVLFVGCFSRWCFSYWGLLWCLPLLFYKHTVPLGRFELIVLDVGQGLSVVVKTKQHVLLYDTGLKYGAWDVGKAIIKPYLDWDGVTKIDKLVVSHGDVDHSGGATYLYDHVLIEQVMSSEPERLKIPAINCMAGQSWFWDGVLFQVLSPPTKSGWYGNQASCVVLVTSQFSSVLLPGDINIKAENWLLAHYDLTVTGIVVAHHGSKTASSEKFLQHIKPKWGVISAGVGNRFGLPSPIIVDRYLTRKIDIHNTQFQGFYKYLG